MTDDLSLPPPPQSEAGRLSPIDPWVEKHVRLARTDATKAIEHASQALTVAVAARDSASELRASVGQSPDPARGIPGSGLLGTVTRLVESLDEAAKARARRSAFFRGVGATLGVVGVTLSILGTIWKWVRP